LTHTASLILPEGALKASERQSIAVVGLGSIGGVVAGLLCDASQHSVVACVRTPIGQLIVEHSDTTIETSITALTSPDNAKPVDWVLLCTKVQDIPSVAHWLKKLCSQGTRVAVLQNGIGHIERLAPFVGDATVLPVVVYYNGERLAANRVRVRHAGQYDLAVRDDEDGRAFADLLAGIPLSILLADDFDTVAWRKLLLNAIANPITALTLQRQLVFRRDDVRMLCLSILKEAIAVGQAAGVHLTEEDAEQTMSTLLTYSPELGTSMYFDRIAGRPLEIESITGAIVALGEQYGLPAPVNSTMLTLLRAAASETII
jgi:2-dehydropantoate 2-reductase